MTIAFFVKMLFSAFVALWIYNRFGIRNEAKLYEEISKYNVNHYLKQRAEIRLKIREYNEKRKL